MVFNAKQTYVITMIETWGSMLDASATAIRKVYVSKHSVVVHSY